MACRSSFAPIQTVKDLALLRAIRTGRPGSTYALARRVGRDLKNVQQDLRLLGSYVLAEDEEERIGNVAFVVAKLPNVEGLDCRLGCRRVSSRVWHGVSGRNVLMELALPLDQMTTAEKLRAVEQIWENLCRTPNDVPSPSWHAGILQDREKRVHEDSSQFVDWAEAKRKIRDSIK